MQNAPTNGHQHTHPHEPPADEEIFIRYNRQTGALSYTFKHTTYTDALGRLALVQLLMYDDYKAKIAQNAQDADLQTGNKNVDV